MAQIATVTGVVGTVFAIAPNGTVRTLKVGDTLQQGEIVRTGANARVELAMADGAATAATTATTATTAGAANGNVAIGSNAIVKVDDNMALGDARPTAQEAAVGIQAIQQVLQALEAGGDLTEELEAAAAGIAGGDGAGSDFVQLARVQLDTDSLSYAFDTAQGGSVELFETGTDVLPEITLGVVAVPDDAPTVQASTNAVLSEADLRVPESGSTVAVGTLVSFSAVLVVAGGTVASVSGSPETAGPGNRLRVVDPASGAQLVKVTNPTDQAMEFEWRDPSGTAYAKGLVASGEVVYLANDSYGGNRAMQLFVRLPGDSVWTGRNRGSLAVDDAESVDFVFPVAVEGVSFLGQLNFNAGADGGRITALSVESVAGLTSGGQPVVFTSTSSADGSTITLTGTAGGKVVLTVEVSTATGAYTATLLAPLDHPLADQSGATDPLNLELRYTVTDADGDAATGSFNVTVRDDAPTVQPSAGVTLDERSLVPDGPSGTVVTGRLVDVGDVMKREGAGLDSVTGSTLTTGPGNTIRLIDPVTEHQMVQVKNPTGQAIDFEWRDNRVSVGTVYAKGTVESGEVLFVSTTAHLGTPTIVLFARFAGVGEFVRANGQGTLGGTSAAKENYPSPLPDPASPLDPGGGTSGWTPVQTTGQLNFNPGADGGRIAALSALAVGGLTAAGQPVEFVQTFLEGADGQPAGFVALTGCANGTPVLRVEVDAATGSYKATLLAPLDHAPAESGAGGSATPLILELGYTVVDGDRDQADGTFVVTVLDGAGDGTPALPPAPPPPPPPPAAPVDGKQLEATANSDTLTGTDSADEFLWALTDDIDPEARMAPGILPPDTLLSLGESGADVLDLRDLFQNAGDVQFNVALDGDNTQETLTGTKDADAFSQTIVLVNFSDGAAGILVQAALEADGTYKYLAP